MRATVVGVVLVLVAAGCGGDDEPEPVASSTSTAPLVSERRTISATETDRIDDDDGEGVLRCEGEGSVTWDYGPIDPDDQRGRRPEDALRDAVVELNEDEPPGQGADLPLEGWVRLDGSNQTYFLLAGGEEWHALVAVDGDEDRGVWRHNSALLCP